MAIEKFGNIVPNRGTVDMQEILCSKINELIDTVNKQQKEIERLQKTTSSKYIE